MNGAEASQNSCIRSPQLNNFSSSCLKYNHLKIAHSACLNSDIPNLRQTCILNTSKIATLMVHRKSADKPITKKTCIHDFNKMVRSSFWPIKISLPYKHGLESNKCSLNNFNHMSPINSSVPINSQHSCTTDFSSRVFTENNNAPSKQIPTGFSNDMKKTDQIVLTLSNRYQKKQTISSTSIIKKVKSIINQQPQTNKLNTGSIASNKIDTKNCHFTKDSELTLPLTARNNSRICRPIMAILKNKHSTIITAENEKFHRDHNMIEHLKLHERNLKFSQKYNAHNTRISMKSQLERRLSFGKK